MGWDGAVYQWKVLGLDEKGEAGGGGDAGSCLL